VLATASLGPMIVRLVSRLPEHGPRGRSRDLLGSTLPAHRGRDGRLSGPL